MLCALVPLEGSQVEVLPCSVTPLDVLEQGPLHCVDCGFQGWKLYWTSGSYHLKEVNEFATSLAKQMVKGDACLVHPSSQQHMLEHLLQSRHWWKTRASDCGLRYDQRDRSTRTIAQKQQTSLQDAFCDAGSSSNPALVKRARSCQRTAAAHYARQRILSSRPHADHSTPRTDQRLWMQHQHQQRPGQLFATGRCLQVGWQSPCSIKCSHSSMSQDTLVGFDDHIPATPCRHQQTGGNRCESLGSAALTGDSCSHDSSTQQAAAFTSSRHEAHNKPQSQLEVQQNTPAAECSRSPELLSCATHRHVACGGSAITSVSASEARVEFSVKEAVLAHSLPPPWDELPEDVVGRVAGFLGKQVSTIMPVYLTCRSWRRAVSDNDQLLSSVSFHLDAARPFRAACGAASAGAWQPWHHRAMRQDHPALLQRAAKLGNVSALVTSARLLDAVGAVESAMRLWRRAAKCGHVEAQLLYGLAQYRGTAGVPEDPEDAHLWLSKALKQVQKHTSTASTPATASGSGMSSVSGIPSAVTGSEGVSSNISTGSNAAATSSTGPSSGMDSADSPGLAARVQSQAGLVLGYLCFDGEVTRSDKQEAVKYFKLSAAAGWGRESREAAQVLGWIWNTGQY